ncbi:SgcJ/EcaC family oxidoreductase [Chelativorans sp. M5D2P16]|uniref:YybH family protein n=1 Tax=Chelativorans sp. M5D2P16 TaxID=3095678 RepID=UPI002ACADBB5|nr:SgcJ/EcaC family oxidoreductase [Chelativorans sp. M5D2P16]MDZ5699964.1 SgcJ/EcaC family oxidoreductase [Chelativorans sp. M5D2P16]
MSADENPIESLLMTQYRAFATRDAALMREVYVEDADWTNAFGRTIKGRDNIVAYLEELFADTNFSNGELVGEPEVSVRAVGEDVVAAKIYTQVKGQRTVDGGTLPVRHNYSLKLIARQLDGSWKILSEIYMDARQDVTHIHAD